jgi:hypothetical protein
MTWTFAILWILAMAVNINAYIIEPRRKKKRIGKHAAFYTNPDTPVKQIYEDANQNKWFAYANPLMIPAARAIAAEAASKAADMCMTPETFARMVQQAKDHANEGDIVECFKVFDRMQERMTQAAEEITLLQLANCYFLLEGEDPEQPNERMTEIKHKIWKEDADCRAFFLIAAYRIIDAYGTASDSDILKYLMEARIRKARRTQSGSIAT